MSTILVYGSGAREHALAWKLSQSPQVRRLIIVPGNDGMDPAWERWEAEPFPALARKARGEKVSLAVIGPDNALAAGASDAFEAEGIPCFGPSQAAAQIESSKAYAKELMTEARVPTARYFVAHTLSEAEEILKSLSWKEGQGWVVKADGLALGKGVRVCESSVQAQQAVNALITVSGSLIIEEKLAGQELSWMAFCDGERCALLEPARDFKRLHDGDQGPNTGGMGAFSPVPGVPPGWSARMREQVFLPILQALKRRGTPFKGVLYAGLMVDPSTESFSVLEFNARFGDPEAQVLLPRLKGDLYDWCLACARGTLQHLPQDVPFREESAVYVVGAAAGYPDHPQKGAVIRLSSDFPEQSPPSEPRWFFAGVRKSKGNLEVSGGRVLGALGVGSSLAEARVRAYAHLSGVSFPGMQHRKDIGGAPS